MKFLDADHPFFAPLWRRWVTVLVLVAWGGFEAWSGNPGWAILFIAAGGYAAWELLIRRPSGK